jgi:hypothetical protein
MNHEYNKKKTQKQFIHLILSARIHLFVRFGRVIRWSVCRRERRNEKEKNNNNMSTIADSFGMIRRRMGCICEEKMKRGKTASSR